MQGKLTGREGRTVAAVSVASGSALLLCSSALLAPLVGSAGAEPPAGAALLVAGIPPLAAGILGIPLAIAGDLLGRRRVTAGGLLLAAIALGVSAWVQPALPRVLLRMATGMAGIFLVGAGWLRDSLAPHRRDGGVAVVAGVEGLSLLFGVGLSGWGAALWGERLWLSLVALLVALAAVFVLRVRTDPPRGAITYSPVGPEALTEILGTAGRGSILGGLFAVHLALGALFVALLRQGSLPGWAWPLGLLTGLVGLRLAARLEDAGWGGAVARVGLPALLLGVAGLLWLGGAGVLALFFAFSVLGAARAAGTALVSVAAPEAHRPSAQALRVCTEVAGLAAG
ncbi:MAG: MFS transporter, partial [Deltaproteobacteria bacterium]